MPAQVRPAPFFSCGLIWLIPSYKNAEPLPARDQKHRVEIAKASNWPGYWGSPGFASAASGAKQWKVSSSSWVELALKILDGFDYRQMKRLGDEIRVDEASIGKNFRQHNQEIEAEAAGMVAAKRAGIARRQQMKL